MPHPNLRPSFWTASEDDRKLFERLLGDFVPGDAFDFHAHLYRAGDLDPAAKPDPQDDEVGLACYRHQMAAWMGDRAPRRGLFFPFPTPAADIDAGNAYCLAETSRSAPSRMLMLIRPESDPTATEAFVVENRNVVVGLKVYHVYALRPDTMHATIDEFLPEWAWEIAARHQLLIMLHIVRPRALADVANQKTLRLNCRKYPGARVVLAHAGRGFNALHTLEGIASVSDLDNVVFDTSAICEPAALLAVLQACGPERLLYGSDFPVSSFRGRCSGVGDGFYWFDEKNVAWAESETGRPTIVGLESLLALQQACQLARLSDAEIKLVFRHNAERLLASVGSERIGR